ncbi:MAG: hypothetical protein E2O39_02435 [Planctomycetota bacterium]|nr:MAG: hypothetical protein E2O39_02435 [Planctomycetota bacterium]
MIPTFLISFAALVALYLAGDRRLRRLQELHDTLGRHFAHADALFARRHDTLERLIETAREALPPEWTTLDALESDRRAASTARLACAKDPTDSAAIQGLASAEQSIDANLARIAAAFAATEPSPDHSLARLLAELTDSRERLDAATRTFDTAMQLYNTELATFPNRLFAAVLHIAPGRMLAGTAGGSGPAVPTESRVRPAS